ncbi:MAG: hypothetical protein KAS32_01135 [Candidatus Peribacteraceae bacterium]|nr:hypothetical protein [Candidatus Peribacteraceae bacterium]
MENVEKVRDHVKIHGFFRVNLEQSGKIIGDSGWQKNQITNLGFLEYLCHTLGGSVGSKTVSYVALGTGTAPGAAATTLTGELMSSTQRKSVAYAAVASTTAQFTATFASSASFLTAAANISNIGLFNATTTNATLFAGNTYASSSCDTNQNVNVTYQIRFS